MSDVANGPVLAADGTPLKKRLGQALFRSKLRAFGLVVPLLLLILMAFLAPTLVFLKRGVYNDEFAKVMVNSQPLLAAWDAKSEPSDEMFNALHADLVQSRKDKSIGRVATRVNRELSGTRSMFTSTARKAEKMEPPFKDALIDANKKWANIEVWEAMKISNKSWTPAYLANAVDLKYNADGSFERKSEERRIHIKLFVRTMEISVIVTLLGVLLGYPVAFLMSSLQARTANLLLILVLLPFWTSLLVRTTAWIALLQGEGVMNDLFVLFGLAEDQNRFSLIYNKTGSLIAMTHILLPFMILPLYSVMKTIPPTYVRAAKSMGASNWTAFWRVYFPQTIPGIGAGGILVFILAISFYITPALVGGESGTMISNFIDFHMRDSLNWSLAAAMGAVLLVIVLFLYWLYDRIVGIDNMKLG
ncbi:polyamine ABC transporter substrate-binding protein [Amylibacter ulvae]|uniref:Polyamine ABC transporter substrate-binding protein n=1 Tax=Paramylibacter ulvae TaxID=1651968 RepID=A0ABQ3D2Q5_9RHOB|nr:ABC transporter permease [Amylibacter ulvae]GHA55330.1 polyamine ABC transporter substrate-binding protein [Amylibacter ulvae]